MYVPQSENAHFILCSQVHDRICCGDEKFLERCSKTEEEFEAIAKLFNSFEFFGVSIAKTNYGYKIDQSKYIPNLQVLTKDATFD